jgi:hypothetical protein
LEAANVAAAGLRTELRAANEQKKAIDRDLKKLMDLYNVTSHIDGSSRCNLPY